MLAAAVVILSFSCLWLLLQRPLSAAPRPPQRHSVFNGDLVTSNSSRHLRRLPDDDPVFRKTDVMPTCQITSGSLARFASLARGNSGAVLLVMNLYNSENVLLNMLRELPIVLDVLAPDNVHVVIYENGSTDRTMDLLQHFAWQLRLLGSSFTFMSAVKPKDRYRI